MSQNDSKYLPELMAEKDSIDPSFVHALRLITQEIEKIKNPPKATSNSGKSEKNLLDVVSGRPSKIECDIRVPVEQHPNINFVGRLIGPGGATMKGIQEVTGTRMAVLGQGTVRDKDRKKVEELREQNDPKYHHLDYPMHVHVSALGDVPQAYVNLGRACAEIQKLLHIDEDTEAQFGSQGMGQGMRGGGRGGMGSSGFRGRGASMPGRGGQRGGRGGMMRGGAPGRGGASSRGMGAGIGAGARGSSRGGTRGRGGRGGQAQQYAQLKQAQESYDDYGNGGQNKANVKIVKTPGRFSNKSYESYGAGAAAATAGYDATGYEAYDDPFDPTYDASYGSQANASYSESYDDYSYGAESYDAYGNGASAQSVKPSFGGSQGGFRGKMRGGMRGRQKPY